MNNSEPLIKKEHTTFGQKVIDFYFSMDRGWKLPEGFDLIDPYDNPDTKDVFSSFYQKYFSDQRKRFILFGINPGRFGAGITGIPFTDPIVLEQNCGIDNSFDKRHELSSIFIYEIIEAFGGISSFYNHFYINSVSPLGFLKDGINCNYYDDAKLLENVKPNIIKGIREQMNFGTHQHTVFSIGKGTNYKFLQKINKEQRFFDRIIPLPHPRWVMQYRRKNKDEILKNIIEKLQSVI